jgi:hypothetical protein
MVGGAIRRWRSSYHGRDGGIGRHLGGVTMLHATRITLIQTLQALLADEQAMLKKLRDRYIELDIERFAAGLEAMGW